MIDCGHPFPLLSLNVGERKGYAIFFGPRLPLSLPKLYTHRGLVHLLSPRVFQNYNVQCHLDTVFILSWWVALTNGMLPECNTFSWLWWLSTNHLLSSLGGATISPSLRILHMGPISLSFPCTRCVLCAMLLQCGRT